MAFIIVCVVVGIFIFIGTLVAAVETEIEKADAKFVPRKTTAMERRAYFKQQRIDDRKAREVAKHEASIKAIQQAEKNNKEKASVIYIWEATDLESHDGDPVYKIGITSPNQGTQRIENVAKAHNLQHRIERIERTRGRAYTVEKALLKLGYHVNMSQRDGYTEFRAMTAADMVKANQLINAAMA